MNDEQDDGPIDFEYERRRTLRRHVGTRVGVAQVWEHPKIEGAEEKAVKYGLCLNWYRTFGTRPVHLRDVVKASKRNAQLREMLVYFKESPDLPFTAKNIAWGLYTWKAGKRVAGLRLHTKKDPSGDARLWYLDEERNLAATIEG